MDLFPQPIELIICTEADKRKKPISFSPLNDIATQKYAKNKGVNKGVRPAIDCCCSFGASGKDPVRGCKN